MLSTFLQKIKNNDAINFNETIAIISENYEYTPTTFNNGLTDKKIFNAAGENEGSCKIFAFALLNQLSEQQTLSLFGDFYKQDVLQHPDANDHQNIRTFMQYGWEGIHFDSPALKAK